MNVTHQPWEENYHRASFLENFSVGGEILESLQNRGAKVEESKRLFQE